jgi:hypothetical protein
MKNTIMFFMFATLAFACKTWRGAVTPCRAGRRQRSLPPGAYQTAPRVSAPSGGPPPCGQKIMVQEMFLLQLARN